MVAFVSSAPGHAEATWTLLGLEGRVIRSLSSNGEYVFAITEDGSFFERSLWRLRIDGSEEPELVWDSSSKSSAFAVACHPLEPDTVYLGLNGQEPIPGPVVWRSVDGGRTFSPHDEGFCDQGGVWYLTASATSPSILTAAAADVPHVSVSGSGTWTPVTDPDGCPCGTPCNHQQGVARGAAPTPASFGSTRSSRASAFGSTRARTWGRRGNS